MLTVPNEATNITRKTRRIKSHDDSATQSCESYMKDPEKSYVRSYESYTINNIARCCVIQSTVNLLLRMYNIKISQVSKN